MVFSYFESSEHCLDPGLNEIDDFAAHNFAFGHYTEEEKWALRRKYHIRELSEEEKQLIKEFYLEKVK